ncbi:hypothetical protein [Clostridium perfringens]
MNKALMVKISLEDYYRFLLMTNLNNVLGNNNGENILRGLL